MNKELLKWEYEAYRRRTRNQRKLSKRNFVLAATVLALFAAVVALATQEEPPAPKEDKLVTEEETPTEAQETPVTVLIEDEHVPVVESVPDDAINLDKLPKMLNATLTHYCLCKKCCGKSPEHPAYGITASGRKAEPYVSVAVDPILIELGSTVYVDYGDGVIHEYRADDTGSGVNGTHIDLCVEDHQEALNLGVRKVTVWYDEK